MKLKEVILEKIPKEEIHKLNVMSLYLKNPETTSKHIVYDRDEARSSFYNSRNIVTLNFYKHTSLLVGYFNGKNK